MAVVKLGKARRERNNSNGYVQRKNVKQGSFSEIMNSELHNMDDTSMEYVATVYGKDMKLSSIQYLTREYHY